MAPPSENASRFALAGVSCMTAAAITNPIDVIKIRMQIDNELGVADKRKATSGGGSGGTGALYGSKYYKGFIRGSWRIVMDEGILGLYTGVTASLMREGIYSTIRLGAYEPLKGVFGATDPRHTPIWKKICAGALSGAIGSAIATPTDLVKVRQQAQRPGEPRRYPGTLSAFRIIFKQEGIAGLYVGMVPTVQRATILTATQIPVYDHVKHTLLNAELMQEGVRLHVLSSMIAGFATALTTSPVDVIKTRMMKQKGKELYLNTWDCLIKTVRTEGPLGLYKGFIPNWMRIGPHTIVTFFVFEQLRRMIGMAPV